MSERLTAKEEAEIRKKDDERPRDGTDIEAFLGPAPMAELMRHRRKLLAELGAARAELSLLNEHRCTDSCCGVRCILSSGHNGAHLWRTSGPKAAPTKPATEGAELDSPPFTPPELKDLAGRGYERRGRKTEGG